MQAGALTYGVITAPTVQARRTLMWSRVFLYIGAGLGVIPGLFGLIADFVSMGQTENNAGTLIFPSLLWLVGGTIFFAYDLWANYWGWVALWQWYRRRNDGDNGALIALIVLTILTGGLPLVIAGVLAAWYGLLGGGIYQYRKAKRAVDEDTKALDAIAPALHAINQNPIDSQAWQALATAYWLKRDFDHAMEAIERAIQLDPNNATLWVLKGGILRNAFAFSRNMSHLYGSLAAFDQALWLDPTSWEAQQARQEALAVRNRIG